MADWLMANDFQPEVGHHSTFRTDPAPCFDGVVHCEGLEIEEGRRLSIAWRNGKPDTVVTFALADEGDATRLTLDHTGFAFRDLVARLVTGPGWKRIVRRKLPVAA